MEGTIYSLLPPLIMLILVLVTRQVLLSLGAGIIVGAFMLHNFGFKESLIELWETFSTIFYAEGEVQIGSILLLSFLLLLGIATAFMTASGGTKAFGEWAIKRIKTRKGAMFMPAILGIIIFIDDYFNSLAVGQVARPLTDRYKVSRAKLAYIIDSTSAPITVISPISSWGAYLIGTIGSIIAAKEIADLGSLEAFVKMIPLNFYAFAAILLVFLTIYRKFDIGAMKKHEELAESTGKLVDESKEVPGDLNNEFKPNDNGSIYHLIVPIITLIVGTVGAMIVTGIQGIPANENVNLLKIFEYTNVNRSLFIGGLLSVISAVVLYTMLRGSKSSIGKVFVEGVKSMLPAIYILILAWMIGTIIGSLETGTYLSDLIKEASFSAAYLPFLVFIVAGIMAFATGTSWGTFGIMLPIAGDIAVNTDVNMFLPSLAAVLAGSVFGDHCSPISDTTILSSTGAGSNHIDHVLTQLPYATIAAVASGIGYLIFGFTTSTLLAFSVTLVIVLGVVLLYKPNQIEA